MQETLNFLIGIYMATAAVAVVLALVFRHFASLYARSYLHHWSLAWAALAVYQVTAMLSLLAAGSTGPLSLARTVPSVISQAAAYMFVTWLILGAYEVSSGARLPHRAVRGMAVVAAGIGVFTALLFAFEPGAGDLRLMFRMVLRSAVTGAAFLLAGGLLWRARSALPGFGQRVVSVVFILYALQLVHMAVMTSWWLSTGSDPGYLQYMGLVDLVALFTIGVGTVIWLLEEEQVRVQRASGEIERLAMQDSLTGLANRQRLSYTLARFLASSSAQHKKLAVLLMDLDRFKMVNETLGHSHGDEILREVASRLDDCVRADDFVARLGGDEFTIIARGISSPRDATVLARKLMEALRDPVRVAGSDLTLTTSIGISLFPDNGQDGETLLRHADTAMYRAKHEGGNRWHIYQSGMEQETAEQLELENDLRRAMVNQELVLMYQPICRVEDRRIVGVEALVRWQHPRRGLLPPSVFLPTAESSGLMEAVDDYVMATAARQVIAWTDTYGEPIQLAVNISPGAVHWSSLPQRIEQVLRATNLEPDRLELEITEHAAIRDLESGHTTLRKLRRLGVRTCIDDFGTGYSSLSYLKRLPMDRLKLDRSFIEDVLGDAGDAAIVDAVVTMAHSLGLEVVGEGVENEAQFRFLERIGCDFAQGYLLHRPMPAPALDDLLLESTTARRPRPSAG